MLNGWGGSLLYFYREFKFQVYFWFLNVIVKIQSIIKGKKV